MYSPRLNDYVKWKKGIEGWVYFVDQQYITIETNVTPKDQEDLRHSPLHRNKRLLVLCYKEQWSELKQVGYRENKYSEEILSRVE
jgi:hypothetical protein